VTVLAFDTSFGACSVAVGPARGIPSQRRQAGNSGSAHLCEPMTTGHAERLVPMIEEVLRMAGLGLSDVEAIAVTPGPGTFTGSRIAVAAARALALARGLPIYTASSLHLLAAAALAGAEDTARPPRIAVAVDAHRGGIYFQLFEGSTPLTKPELLTPLEAVDRLALDETLVVGSGQELLMAALPAGHARVAGSRESAPQPDARFLLRIARLERVDRPQPLYLRPPDAKPQDGKSIARA